MKVPVYARTILLRYLEAVLYQFKNIMFYFYIVTAFTRYRLLAKSMQKKMSNVNLMVRFCSFVVDTHFRGSFQRVLKLG